MNTKKLTIKEYIQHNRDTCTDKEIEKIIEILKKRRGIRD